MLVREQLASGSSLLDLRLATTGTRPVLDHVLVLVHGLPRTFAMGKQAAGTLPELAEYLANETGWLVAVGTMSGVGQSTGSFSVNQWRGDLNAVIDRVVGDERRVSLAGFGLGGTLALAQAAVDERVRGVAAFASPVDLVRWVGDAATFLMTVQAAGVIDAAAPAIDANDLADQILALDPLGAAKLIPPKRFLIVHGSDDPEIPVIEARELLEAADGRAELRVIQGAGHWLRSDPRLVATLLGWLDRHR